MEQVKRCQIQIFKRNSQLRKLKLDVVGNTMNSSAYGTLGGGTSNHSGLQSPLQMQNSTYESSIAT